MSTLQTHPLLKFPDVLVELKDLGVMAGDLVLDGQPGCSLGPTQYLIMVRLDLVQERLRLLLLSLNFPLKDLDAGSQKSLPCRPVTELGG